MDGYIRAVQKGLIDVIPKEINEICFVYYFEKKDKFDGDVSSAEEFLKISSDGNTATAIGMDPDREFITALGSTVIPSINNEKIYEWTFKIKHNHAFYAVGIGEKPLNGLGVNESNHYHIYNAYNGKIHCYKGKPFSKQIGPIVYTGDTMKLILNMKQSTLSYVINDIEILEDGNPGFDNLAKGEDINYRVMVCFYFSNDSIELVHFSAN